MSPSEPGAKGSGNEITGDLEVEIKREGPLEVFKQRGKRL